MPLIRPTLTQLVNRIRADVTRLLPELDPTVSGSFIRAIVESVGIRINAANLLLDQVVREAFPQTATGENLERFAENITRRAASGSRGDIVIFGNALAVVPIGSALTSQDGQIFTLTSTVTLAQQTASISALSASGGVATAVSAGHPYADGQEVTVSGADDGEYNGTVRITVVDANTFTYPIDGSPNSPTSGTIIGTFTGASATVESAEEGADTNLDGGSRLTLTTSISGVTSATIARFDGVTGGADVEDDESFRSRILEVRAGIAANFSPDAIVQKAKETPGVTRVSVRRATPTPGDVTVNFVRDGDANLIPSAADVAAIRASLLEILPATSEESALIVAAPVAVSTNFDFSSVTPNTDAMKEAIQDTLEAFYEDEVAIGSVITEDAYRAAILQTVAGDVRLESFSLSAPSGNIVITGDQIGVLGDVTFP